MGASFLLKRVIAGLAPMGRSYATSKPSMG